MAVDADETLTWRDVRVTCEEHLTRVELGKDCKCWLGYNGSQSPTCRPEAWFVCPNILSKLRAEQDATL